MGGVDLGFTANEVLTSSVGLGCHVSYYTGVWQHQSVLLHFVLEISQETCSTVLWVS